MLNRFRNKTIDPEWRESYLFDMVLSNPEIQEFFTVDTMHVLDHHIEYDQGIPDAEEFPEFQNPLFKFFNVDAHMTTGHFTFADVQSGATMEVKFGTMPVKGHARFEVGEPFYLYDVVAEISHEGVYKEVVLVDRAESLKKHRPFLHLV